MSKISSVSPSWLSEIMKNYFTGVHQIVRSGKRTSASMPCNTGVIQGSVLAPFCFNAITDDLTIDDAEKLLIKFSDDQTLVFSIQNQTDWENYLACVREISQWASENHLLLNPTKTQELVFTIIRMLKIL